MTDRRAIIRRVRVPDQLLDWVCFLGVADDEDGVVYGGSAFGIRVVTGAGETERGFTYLATARHNVVRARAMEGRFVVRFNADGGDALLFDLAGPTWYFADDAAVDVALLPGAGIDESPWQPIPVERLISADALRRYDIGPGDDIFAIGLFTQRHGVERNLPVLRTGTIASVADEPFEDQNTGTPYSAYLVELHSVGGLSGSPVFIYVDNDRLGEDASQASAGKLLLLGLIRGHFNANEAFDYAYPGGEADVRNTGIAIVTPAQEILDLISSDALLEERRTRAR